MIKKIAVMVAAVCAVHVFSAKPAATAQKKSFTGFYVSGPISDDLVQKSASRFVWWNRFGCLWLENDFAPSPSFSKIQSCRLEPVCFIKRFIESGEDVAFWCSFVKKIKGSSVFVDYVVSVTHRENEVIARVHGKSPQQPACIKALLTLIEVILTKKPPSFLSSNALKIGAAAVAGVIVVGAIANSRRGSSGPTGATGDGDLELFDPEKISEKMKAVIEHYLKTNLTNLSMRAVEGVLSRVTRFRDACPEGASWCSEKISELEALLKKRRGAKKAFSERLRNHLLPGIDAAIKDIKREKDPEVLYELTRVLEYLNNTKQKLERDEIPTFFCDSYLENNNFEFVLFYGLWLFKLKKTIESLPLDLEREAKIIELKRLVSAFEDYVSAYFEEKEGDEDE